MPRAARFILALALLFPARGHAQEYGVRTLALRGVGATVFSVVPARSDPTVGIHLVGYLGRLTPRIRVTPSLTFWATQLQDPEVIRVRQRVEALCEDAGSPCEGLDFGKVDLSDLSLDLDGQYIIPGPFGLRPYLGAGVGLHLVNGGGELIDNTFVEEILDAITPGMNAMAGIEIPLVRGLRVHGEVRGVLAGGANWIGAGVGGSIVLPTRRAPAVEGGR